MKIDVIMIRKIRQKTYNELIGMVVDATFKLNEMARALSINPSSPVRDSHMKFKG